MDLRLALASAALATALTPTALTPTMIAAAAHPAMPARPTSPTRPASWPAYCAGPPPAVAPPLNHGLLFNPDDHSDLTLGTPGLPDEISAPASAPSAIAAGSGWHDFQLTAALPVQSANSDLTGSPHAMKWTVFVSTGAPANSMDNGTSNTRPNDMGSARVQYRDGAAWSDLPPWDGAGTKLVTTPFAIGGGAQTATASLQLRFEIGAGAPRGPAYVVEFGTYVDAEQACTHATFDANKITVGAPGSGPGRSRSAEYTVGGAIIIVAGSAAALIARRRGQSAR